MHDSWRGQCANLGRRRARLRFSSARLVQLERQPVGIAEEGEALVGIRVDPDRFDRHPRCHESRHHRRQIGDGKGEMPQPGRFGIGRPRRGCREGEELELRRPDAQVRLPRLSLGAIDFVDQLEAEQLDIEAFRAFVIGADQGDMMGASSIRKALPTAGSAAKRCEAAPPLRVDRDPVERLPVAIGGQARVPPGAAVRRQPRAWAGTLRICRMRKWWSRGGSNP